MHGDVLALLLIYMKAGLSLIALFFLHLHLAVFCRGDFRYRFNLIVARPRRDPRSEFAVVVRHELPFGPLLVHRMDVYSYAIKRALIRTKSRPKNKRIVLMGVFAFIFALVFVSLPGKRGCIAGTNKRRKHRNADHTPPSSTHFPLLPRRTLFRPHPHRVRPAD